MAQRGQLPLRWLIRHKLSGHPGSRSWQGSRPPLCLLAAHPHVYSVLYLQTVRCAQVSIALSTSTPCGAFAPGKHQVGPWAVHHWGQGGPGVLCSQAGGWPVGAAVIFCRWPLDRRHKIHVLIPALPLAHTELKIFLLTGPQFPTCKMGRSQLSV